MDKVFPELRLYGFPNINLISFIISLIFWMLLILFIEKKNEGLNYNVLFSWTD